jgi:hypothetical protein
MERQTKKRWIWTLVIIGAPLGLALFGYLAGQVVMYLWNWLMPELFGLRTITFWKSLGLLALCRILFGGFGMNSGGGYTPPRKKKKDRGSMRDAIRERWGDPQQDAE